MCNEAARRIELGLLREDFAHLRIPLHFPEGLPNMQPLPSVRITNDTVIVRAVEDGSSDAELVTAAGAGRVPTESPSTTTAPTAGTSRAVAA